MKSFLFISGILISASASAGTLNCAGSYFGHQFKVRAQTSETALVGAAHLSVSGPFHNQEGDLELSTSEIRAGASVRFSGTSDDGNATLDAKFRSGQTYVGTLAVSGSGGSGNVPVTCTLSSRDDDSGSEE